MDDIDFTSLTDEITGSTDIMHHQAKLDVFVIKAYKLVSHSSIINSNTLQSVISSPQTTNTTPASSSTTNSLSIVGVNGGLLAGDMTTSNSGNAPNSSHLQSQYSQIFGKISKLYNSIISIGSIDDRSTSPKSPMELYQRFKQMIKELDLRFEVSPHSQYFTRLDDGIWQIKEDSELENDQLWRSISVAIYSIYDPSTGQLISQNRNKKNFTNNGTNNGNGNKIGNNNPNLFSSDVSTRGMSSNNNNNPSNTNSNNNSSINNNDNNNNNNNNINNQDDGNNNNNNTGNNNMPNQTINNMLMDASLPHQLQKRLQSITQDVTSRSLNGYYTQPTSPGYGGFSFNQTEVDPSAQLNYHDSGTNSMNIWKRKSLSSLDVDTLDDVAVEELLQLTNINKRQRTNQMDENVGVNPNDVTTAPNTVEVMNFNTTPSNTSNDSNVAISKPNSANGKQTKPKSRGKSARSNNANSRRGKTSKNNIADTKISDNALLEMNLMNDTNSIIHAEIITKQVKGTYDALVLEKDQRIIQLERELELQRQETQWLRKMLIEDMGCIRSLLTDLRK